MKRGTKWCTCTESQLRIFELYVQAKNTIAHHALHAKYEFTWLGRCNIKQAKNRHHFSLFHAQAASELSLTTTLRISSSFSRSLRVNLSDLSSALMPSLSDLLASSKEGFILLPETDSSENNELQAVLSVHSVPQRDSRSSLLVLGL